MSHTVAARAVRTFALTSCLIVLSAGLAFTQTPSSDANSVAIPSAAHVAYVYVGTASGVNLYDAASNGKLTPVSSSPFAIAGTAVGSNGKYFISLDPGYLHSYPVTSNGAIKPQASQIYTLNYSSECQTTTAADIDHTGQEVYVQLAGPSSGSIVFCNLLESFKISSSSGSLTFLGSSTAFGFAEPSVPASPLSIMANDAYAYDLAPIDLTCYSQRNAFHRDSSGAFDVVSFTETDPIPEPGWHYTLLRGQTEDPTNHLAAAVEMAMGGTCGPFKSAQLVSYTVDTQGNVTSTNPWENAPTPEVYPAVLNMSPSGKLLAVGGDTNIYGDQAHSLGTNGLQIFHFNGADPITPYSKTLTTAPIDQIHWDNNDHLYALSDSAHKLYVYTVTPTSITQAPGSPYTIASPNALVVVPILCSAPSSAGVNICAPASGSTGGSPVLVEASATVTGTIARMELWVDGVKKYTAASSKELNTTIGLAAGSHRFGVFAVNTAGQKWEQAINATVK